METPEQQRRPAIGQFAKTLANAQLDFDAIDLADILWLAQFLEPAQPVPVVTQAQTGEPSKQPIQTIDSSESALHLYPNDSVQSQEHPSKTGSEQTSEQQSAKPKGMPFSVPAAPALRTRLDLARSLRPLMRKIPSRSRFDLDEDATVTQIAETEVWMPVVRPSPERWLELDLVVEASKTTVIWERAIAELHHLAEYQGAFRAVRTWRLTAQTGTVQLFPRWQDYATRPSVTEATNQRPHTPGELIDPTGRRLIWLVTDCTSALWRQDLFYETLLDWAKNQPIAIVQMFPDSLWSRTALRNGHIVKLGAIAPGLPSAELAIEGLPQRLQQRSRRQDLVTVPIMTLEAVSMLRWARVAAGAGATRTPGRTFDRAFIRKQAAEIGKPLSARSPSQRTAQERVALFRSTASKTAQQLANLMAAAPVSLPVVDLLRDAFRANFEEEVQQFHVAEVLLSGLLRRCDAEEEAVCRYEFFGDGSAEPNERVRDILLGDASIAQSIAVLNVLSESICRKLDSPSKSFQALLAELQKDSEGELRDAALPFARIGLDVLRRLGGEYAALAQRYESGVEGVASQATTFPLEAVEYEVAELIEALPISPYDYESATITAILERFDFETARMERQNRWLGLRQNWVIRRRPAVAWGYREILTPESATDAVTLEMIAIPGGTFTMGSPESEPGSDEDERPQHDVTLQPFYLGRYPITQAQWRMVAGYPRVNKALNPDPSRFQGDNRPVEQVSWEDAQEFCRRLSQQTGKPYRLPSEAEWEYACRAGTTTPFHVGETITTDLANYDGDITYNQGPKGEYRNATTEVGQFPANEWGLHDLHGNVWEWCADDLHTNYEGAPADGSAWVDAVRENTSRVLRGGSWSNPPGYCRSATRHLTPRVPRNDPFGFRVCCVPPRTLPA